jgi:16S rRNA processing protein RimM
VARKSPTEASVAVIPLPVPGKNQLTGNDDRLVVAGQISGHYGVKGWVKVFSFTQPRARIVSYAPWVLRRGEQTDVYEVAEGKAHGKGVIVRLSGIDNRESAAGLIGAEILVDRQRFAELEPGEYYWSDLMGLAVQTESGQKLGIVDHLLETGANDVLVIEGERRRLIPFLKDTVIRQVDLDAGLIVVCWDPDF